MLRSKRYIAAFLSAAMIMSSFSFWAFADDEVSVDDEVAAEEVQEEEEEEAPAVAEVVETAIEEEALLEDEESAELPETSKSDETVPEDGDSDSEIVVPGATEDYDLNLRNNDKLFELYAEKEFNITLEAANGSSGSTTAVRAGDKLQGFNKKLYDYVVTQLELIADGESSTSEFNVNIEGILSELGIQQYYTKAELGVDSFYDGQYLSDETSEAINNKYGYSLNKVFHALSADYPYQMYWVQFSKVVVGTSVEKGGVDTSSYFGIRGSGEIIGMTSITFRFVVDRKYRSDETNMYSVDTAKTGVVQQAAGNAARIVNDAKGMTDYYKLTYYKNKICDLVTYDHSAASNGTQIDRGPWALVYVFDGNSQTNVVCEGYSEAFQYLCEMSDFSNASVYSVTGYMYDNTNDVSTPEKLDSHGHKWNLVRIGTVNYIADVTNSDSGSIGQSGGLFLNGMLYDSANNRYYKAFSGKTLYYQYDEDLTNLFDESFLVLSSSDYQYSPETTPDDKIRLEGMNLTLKDDIAMNFYFSDSNSTITGDFVTFKLSNGIFSAYSLSDMIKKTVTDGLTGKTSTYYVCSVELSAKDMTYEVPMYVSSGSAYGVTKTYSIRQYANAVLEGNQYTETQKSLVKAMLNYGAYAQKYFGYNTENLANSTVNNISIVDNIPTSSVDLSSFSIDVSSLNGSVGFAGSSLVLSGKTSMKLYFDKTATISNVSCTNDSNVEVDVIESGDGQYQIVRIRNISPANLDTSFTISMSVGGASKTISVNPMAYGKAVLNMQDRDSLKNLVTALRLYNQAAKAIN